MKRKYIAHPSIKKVLTSITLVLIAFEDVLSCEVCKRNQPEILQDITHGAAPSGTLDYIITWTAVAAVAVTLFLSVKFLFKPGEGDPAHIKNITKK